MDFVQVSLLLLLCWSSFLFEGHFVYVITFCECFLVTHAEFGRGGFADGPFPFDVGPRRYVDGDCLIINSGL